MARDTRRDEEQKRKMAETQAIVENVRGLTADMVKQSNNGITCEHGLDVCDTCNTTGILNNWTNTQPSGDVVAAMQEATKKILEAREAQLRALLMNSDCSHDRADRMIEADKQGFCAACAQERLRLLASFLEPSKALVGVCTHRLSVAFGVRELPTTRRKADRIGLLLTIDAIVCVTCNTKWKLIDGTDFVYERQPDLTDVRNTQMRSEPPSEDSTKKGKS